MTAIWLGLCSGIVFGFIIQRMGATDPERMAQAHLMREGDIPKFMVLAVAFSALGVWGLSAAGVGRLAPLPTSLVATGLGALVFGVGWGICGYCPGTCWAAAGEGRMDAIFALLGGFAGTFVFAELHETLIPALYLPTNIGPLTLSSLLGGQAPAAILLAAAMFAAAFAIGKLWRNGDR